MEEVIFEVILPNWISFGTTMMGSKAAWAAGSSRYKDLQLGNNGPGSETSGLLLLCFIFFVLFFSVSLKRNVLRMSPTIIRIWKHMDYSNEHYKPRVEDIEAENC